MISQALHFRFALAKHLYINAVANTTGPLTRRVVSIHNVDMAIEMTLKTLATELNVGIRPNVRFPELWRQVDIAYSSKYNKAMPLKAEIEKVHNARNNVQHQGIIPSETDLKQFLDFSTQFLNEVLLAATGLGLDQLFLSSIISKTELRGMMELAEKNVSSDPRTSMIASMKSFGWSKVLAKRQLGYFDPTLGALDRRKKLERAMEKPLTEVLIPILDHLTDIELGIDPAIHSRILKIAPYPIITIGMTKIDDVHIAETAPFNYTESNAWFCYDFVIQNILRWQDKNLL